MKKIYHFNLEQCGDGAGHGGSEKLKSILTSSRDVGLKSRPIPTSSPLQNGKNLRKAKQRGPGQTG